MIDRRMRGPAMAGVLLAMVLAGCSGGREGLEPQSLTAESGDERHPAFSPDSAFVAFSYTDGGSSRIGIIRLSDREVRSLTRSGHKDEYPAWSGDGKWIAFTSNRDGNSDLYVVGAEAGEGEKGEGVRRLTDDPAVDRRPTWKPDGSMLAFESNRSGRFDVWTVNADGSNPVALTRSTSDDTWPAWSPDGKLIAFTSTRSGNPDIYMMDPDGSHPRHITDKPWDEWCPRWTPDSGQFVHILINPDDGTTEFWSVDTRAEKVRQICASRDDICDPVVSPDGRWLAFSSNHKGGYNLYLLRLSD